MIDKQRVLIVDDDKANRMVLADLLKDEYKLILAKSGTMALELAERHAPDLILLDVLMPDMDGYKVLSALKFEERTRHIPVLLITGLTQVEAEEKGLSLGADDYITKPFHVALVRLRVRNHAKVVRQRCLLEESHQRLREIAHRQTLSDERQRLTQDMHDGMGSSLLTALLAVERGHIDTAMVADVLKNCIDDLKLTIDSMEPIQADLLLLLATLRFRLGPRLESAGIKLRWEVENVPVMEWIDPRNALHILRILQEAFANIVKHAAATEIRVATCVESDTVLVIITDDGLGFSVDEGLDKDGKGLRNQMRRAASIGAEVKLESGNPGTRLTLRLPIVKVL